MKKNKKIDTKFEIEEVENRVEFFFLSGVLGKVLGASPYTRGTSSSDWGGWGSWCKQPKTYCGSTTSTSSGGGWSGGWGWSD